MDIARELRRDMPDSHKVVQLVMRDVAASAALLKTVNSAFYGLVTKARSIQQAIAYLGLDRTALLLAGLLLRNAFPKSNSMAMARFWESSMQTALTTAFMSRVAGIADRDEAHTYGLFRDVGTAVLIGKFENYSMIVERAGDDSNSSLTEIEKQHFGVDHAVVGAVMAREWQLPEEMSDAILWHHAGFVLDLDERPISDDAARLLALGTLSDSILDRYYGEKSSDQTSRSMESALAVIGMPAAHFADLSIEVMTMLDDVAGKAAPTLRLSAIVR
jgi:putative nucleotidyltransferase with HDIG domain